MLMDKTNDAQAQAFQHNDQTFHDPSQVIETEYHILTQHYESLYQDYQALLKCYPTKQDSSPDSAMFRQTLYDYRQSLHEHKQSIQQFRRTLHKLMPGRSRSLRSNQDSSEQADRPLIRAAILLGTGNAQEAAFLKECVQQASTYRVFLAADSGQMLRLLHNVHIDMLVLDEGLIPLPDSELYRHLHSMKHRLPAIIMSASFRFLRQLERTHSHFIGLEKPVQEEALLKAIGQHLVLGN